MRDVSMSRPCERRDPSVSAIALIAAARTLVSVPEQRPFFAFEARGDGSLRSQGRPAESLCEATTASTHGSTQSYALALPLAGGGLEVPHRKWMLLGNPSISY